MKIGILGSGKVGTALGSWAARKQHEVAYFSKSKEHAEKAGRYLPLRELLEFADLVLLTVPFSEVENALRPVRDQLLGRLLVDVTNPITPDHKDLILGRTDSGAEQIARNHPGALIVKAFNAVFAEVYQSQNPERDGHRISIVYCGDDDSSKARVRQLIEDLGFDAVDAGPLRNARFLEPLSLLNIHLGRVLGYGTSIGFSLLR